jgi:hypothetical protein
MSDKKSDNFMEGYYMGSREQKGKDGNFVIHTIHKINDDGTLGEKWDVSGGVVLDKKFDEVAIGAYVGIQYKGRKHKQGYDTKTPYSQTNSYHIWDLFVDGDAVSYASLGGTTKKETPAGTSQSTQDASQSTTKTSASTYPEDDDDLPF